MKNHLLNSVLLTVLGLIGNSVLAHSLPVDNGTINVAKNTAYLVLSLPIHSFVSIDDNIDGKLSHDELLTHEKSIKKQITSGFSFTNKRQKSFSQKSLSIISLTPTVEQNSSSHSHEPMSESELKQLQATHLTVLATVHFSEKIEQLQVSCDLFKTAAPSYQFTLFAKHAQPAIAQAAQQQLKREKATLSHSQTIANFFTSAKRKQ